MLTFRHISLVSDRILGWQRGIDCQHGDLGIVCFSGRQGRTRGRPFSSQIAWSGVSSAFGDFDTMSQGDRLFRLRQCGVDPGP